MKGALATLAERWRNDAAVLRRHGHERSADQLERRATEVEDAWRATALEALTIKEASKETGYSESHLYALVENGAVENIGKPGAPRIRRADLPAKSNRLVRRELEIERAAITSAAMQQMNKSLQDHLATSLASCAIKDASKHLGAGEGDE